MIWVFAYLQKQNITRATMLKTQTMHSKFHSTLESQNNSHPFTFSGRQNVIFERTHSIVNYNNKLTLSALFCFDDWFENMQLFYDVSIF